MPGSPKKSPKKGSPTKKGSPKKGGKRGKKAVKRRRTRRETYGGYIYRVLKQVHPDVRISNKAMSVMNCFLNDLLQNFASEASRLVMKKSMPGPQIHTSLRLLVPANFDTHGKLFVAA